MSLNAIAELIDAAWHRVTGERYRGDVEIFGVKGVYRFDIKTISEANGREHWAAKHKRKKKQQADFAALWRMHRPKITLPATITFTRYSCKLLDADNLAGAFKHVQDQLARELGIDDGSDAVRWRYEQERIKTREHYFTITAEGRAGAVESSR